MAETETFNDVDLEKQLAFVDEIPESEHPAGIEMTEWVFSNDKAGEGIRKLFHMFMNSVFANKVGLVHALNTENDEIQTLIVGVEPQEGGVALWPLAKILTEAEQKMYKTPDGNGGWLS